jgi:hypothetical protein
LAIGCGLPQRGQKGSLAGKVVPQLLHSIDAVSPYVIH